MSSSEPRLNGLAWAIIALDWWTAIGVIVALAGLFTDLPDASAIFWPAQIQPAWLGIVLGVVGFFVLTTAYGLLDERGKTNRSEGEPGQE